MEPLALGIILRIEAQGWSGPAPRLPNDPVRTDEGREGARIFIYDLSPKDPTLSVSDACLRIASKLERMLAPERTPFNEPHHATRCTLEFGVLADRERESFSYSWPLEFLTVLADAQIELNVSHYLPTNDEEDGEA
jgi:hypothetical protein